MRLQMHDCHTFDEAVFCSIVFVSHVLSSESCLSVGRYEKKCFVLDIKQMDMPLELIRLRELGSLTLPKGHAVVSLHDLPEAEAELLFSDPSSP